MFKALWFRTVLIFALVGVAATAYGAKAKMTPCRYWHFVENVQVTGDAPEVRLWVALPVEHRGQTVEMGEIYPEPVKIFEDPLGGNRIIFWRQTDVKDGEDFYFYYDFKYAAEEVNANVDPLKLEPYDVNSAEYKRYTQSEPWVEITDDIRAKAAEIVGDEDNPYFQARIIYDWVVRNILYRYPDVEGRGAAKSFARRSGDCGEFSVIICAMCRSLGIPARTVTNKGYWNGGHQWAEVLLPPYGWVPVDGSVGQVFVPGVKVTVPKEGVAETMETWGIPEWDANWLFGNLSARHLIVSIGNNHRVDYPELGVAKTFRFLQPGGGCAYPSAVELRGLSDKTVDVGFFMAGKGYDDPAAAGEKAAAALADPYLEIGEYAQAEAGLLQTLKENPNSAPAWLSLGRAYLEQDKTDEAIDAFGKCLAGKGGSTKLLYEAWAHNFLGVCYEKKGDDAAARKEFMWALARGCDYAGSLAFAEEHLDGLPPPGE